MDGLASEVQKFLLDGDDERVTFSAGRAYLFKRTRSGASVYSTTGRRGEFRVCDYNLASGVLTPWRKADRVVAISTRLLRALAVDPNA